MKFKEIMEMPNGLVLKGEEKDNRPVWRHLCEELNRQRHLKPPCSGYSDTLFMFFVPDHDINSPQELWEHIDWENMEFGVFGTRDTIQNYFDLLRKWLS
jgi:hypothetical protein